MKKAALALVMILLMGCVFPVLAETSFDGVIVASDSVPVEAPFGAIVDKLYVREGDMIYAGDPIVDLRATKVFAPCDGTLSAFFAEEGDTLDNVKTLYGGVAYIEPVHQYLVSATTEKAYSAAETKKVHIGETVYLSCSQDGTHTGPAIISAVGDVNEDGNTEYTLEVTGGEFYIGETVDIYRSPDLTNTTRLGRGTVKQMKPVAVDGSGSLLKAHVKPGDKVRRGQLLFETVEGVLAGLYPSSLRIVSPMDGIVSKVNAEPGGTVTQETAVATLYPISALEAEVTVPVADINSFKKGQKTIVELDIGADDVLRYEGEVTGMSYIVTGEGRNMSLKAYVAFKADDNVRVGMPVIIYTVRDAEPAKDVEPEVPGEGVGSGE